ncbi:TVP38/TMEM64 family protein [Lentzea sp. CA-135723]|uniref:TVP38/TMEM64 family protein n=1 Tax=Lentzea sp. CA-135723 TaxID=3239950 RepID=UPI003D8B2FA3
MSYETGVRWKWIPAVVLGFVLLSWIVFEALDLIDFDGVVAWVRGIDPVWAAAAIFALLVVDVLLPVPSTPLIVLAGTALGLPFGLALAIVGSLGSSAAGYALGRFAGPWLVRRVVTIEELTEMRRWGRQFGPWFFGVARGIPMMAETVSVSAGVSRVSFRTFMAFTLVGTVPICAAYVFAGSQADTVEQIVMISAVGFLLTVGLFYLLRRLVKAAP